MDLYLLKNNDVAYQKYNSIYINLTVEIRFIIDSKCMKASSHAWVWECHMNLIYKKLNLYVNIFICIYQ